LERFAHIVGTHWDTLTYVDCFSGPWNARSNKFQDSSFGIAINELRKARDTHAQRGRKLRLRCFFLEKASDAYQKLDRFTHGIQDVEITARNATLEESVGQIGDFVRAGGQRSFPFVFIDPTGWTGFDMATIAPLLRFDPGEVLINFMTGHIRRFLESPQKKTQESFKRLFGSARFREKVQGLAQQDHEDAAVREYIKNAKAVGGFSFGCTALVLHPELNRTHFNLIYLTRDPKGVEVFKDAEKKAMEVQEAARATAQQRRRVDRSGQSELFGSKELHHPSHYEYLRDHYLIQTRDSILEELRSKRRLLYEHAWTVALSKPLCWESDLKNWIDEWKRAGQLDIVGMKLGQRVPHRNAGNYLVWREG
jgi:three-Cys-motif partner protein